MKCVELWKRACAFIRANVMASYTHTHTHRLCKHFYYFFFFFWRNRTPVFEPRTYMSHKRNSHSHCMHVHGVRILVENIFIYTVPFFALVFDYFIHSHTHTLDAHSYPHAHAHAHSHTRTRAQTYRIYLRNFFFFSFFLVIHSFRLFLFELSKMYEILQRDDQWNHHKHQYNIRFFLSFFIRFRIQSYADEIHLCMCVRRSADWNFLHCFFFFLPFFFFSLLLYFTVWWMYRWMYLCVRCTRVCILSICASCTYSVCNVAKFIDALL